MFVIEHVRLNIGQVTWWLL